MHPEKLIAHIETTAPLFLAEPWDKCGVQIASQATDIRILCVALDPTLETIQQAIDLGADFLLCHHPVTLSPKLPNKVDDFHRMLSLALGRGLWVYSAHTTVDANPQGPVHWLARRLGLLETRVLEVTQVQTQTYVRLLKHVDTRIIENFTQYSHSTGESIGEFLLWPKELDSFQRQLPAGSYVQQPVPFNDHQFGFGCIGTLPTTLPWSEFAGQLAQILPVSWRMIGTVPEHIRSVAYCPGSGADFAPRAFALGADIFLTGDLKYHQAQALEGKGFTLDVGHFYLEEAMMQTWSDDLARELAPDVQVLFISGRDPFTMYCQQG